VSLNPGPSLSDPTCDIREALSCRWAAREALLRRLCREDGISQHGSGVSASSGGSCLSQPVKLTVSG
jgi:hypothetical protein